MPTPLMRHRTGRDLRIADEQNEQLAMTACSAMAATGAARRSFHVPSHDSAG